jgi:glutamate dehydrogenase (NADP+)
VLEASQLAERDVPDYLEVDHGKMTAKFTRFRVARALSDPRRERALSGFRRWNRIGWSSSSTRADPPLIERICEPERQIIFRVPWVDDKGGRSFSVHINRGFRVEFNSALGPYKGGLRFHPSVNVGIIKFLGFEQTFKNALTGMPIGGGKGGADFDPKGRSDGEIMRFCQSFMTELYRHLGEYTDVPAGDIGVGGREIGYMFGQYKRITNRYESGVSDRQGPLGWGGSLVRTEATGYGATSFRRADAGDQGRDVRRQDGGGVWRRQRRDLRHREESINSAARSSRCSDSAATSYDEDGIDLALIKEVKEVRRGAFPQYAAAARGAVHHYAEGSIWDVPCDIAMPCADAERTVRAGRAHAGQQRRDRGGRGREHAFHAGSHPRLPGGGVLFGPGKAANAGGVATSRAGNAAERLPRFLDVRATEKRLSAIMTGIHAACAETAAEYGAPGDYVLGANIAGFIRVARNRARTSHLVRAGRKHVAAIAGLEGNAQGALVAEFGQFGQHGDDFPRAGGGEGVRHARAGVEHPEVEAGREDDGVIPGLLLAQRLAGVDPDGIDGLAAVVHRQLIRRRGGEKEMRVEALGHDRRRDPVRIGRQQIERQNEVFVREHVGECAPRRSGDEAGATRAVDKRRRAARAGEQNAAFLEGFADSGDAEGARRDVQTVHGGAADGVGSQRRILRIEAAAGKDQRAGGEIDLVVAHHHEDLEPGRAVAQQENRGGQADGGFGHGACLLPRLLEDSCQEIPGRAAEGSHIPRRPPMGKSGRGSRRLRRFAAARPARRPRPACRKTPGRSTVAAAAASDRGRGYLR